MVGIESENPGRPVSDDHTACSWCVYGHASAHARHGGVGGLVVAAPL